MDNESTYSFIYERLQQQLPYKVVKVTPISVSTAGGNKLLCNRKCLGFKWQINNMDFSFNIRILDIDDYNLVLGADWKLDCAYRPQSSGQVERMNRTLKETLTKLALEGSLGGAAVWCLPLAQGAILETRDRIPHRAPGAWSLLLPLPVSLPLSLSLCLS